VTKCYRQTDGCTDRQTDGLSLHTVFQKKIGTLVLLTITKSINVDRL